VTLINDHLTVFGYEILAASFWRRLWITATSTIPVLFILPQPMQPIHVGGSLRNIATRSCH
jgi:hypothetical protein